MPLYRSGDDLHNFSPVAATGCRHDRGQPSLEQGRPLVSQSGSNVPSTLEDKP